MNIQTFIILLTILATVTSLLTEAVKSFLDAEQVKYASNMLVLFIAIVVGCLGTAVYYIAVDVDITLLNIILLFFMGICNWIGAMVGYDKVKQAIEQIGGLHD